MKFSKVKLFSLGIGFLVAFGTSVVLSKPVAASVAEGNACTNSCGPAPCCMILWVPWCGCWFAEEEAVQ